MENTKTDLETRTNRILRVVVGGIRLCYARGFSAPPVRDILSSRRGNVLFPTRIRSYFFITTPRMGWSPSASSVIGIIRAVHLRPAISKPGARFKDDHHVWFLNPRRRHKRPKQSGTCRKRTTIRYRCVALQWRPKVDVVSSDVNRVS